MYTCWSLQINVLISCSLFLLSFSMHVKSNPITAKTWFVDDQTFETKLMNCISGFKIGICPCLFVLEKSLNTFTSVKPHCTGILQNGCRQQPRPSRLYQIIKLICRLGMPGLLEWEADLNGCSSSQISVRGQMDARKAPISLFVKWTSVASKVKQTGGLEWNFSKYCDSQEFLQLWDTENPVFEYISRRKERKGKLQTVISAFCYSTKLILGSGYHKLIHTQNIFVCFFTTGLSHTAFVIIIHNSLIINWWWQPGRRMKWTSRCFITQQPGQSKITHLKSKYIKWRRIKFLCSLKMKKYLLPSFVNNQKQLWKYI